MIEPRIEEFRLQIEKITARTMVNPANLSLRGFEDDSLDRYVVECVRRVCFLPAVETLVVPDSWWQAFKQRWFPLWALRRWPPRCTLYRARAYFPMLPVKKDEYQYMNIFTFKKEDPRG